MTAGSWIYIGTQGILQGTYETFAAVAAKRFGGTLAGTITLTAGLGGMGGAQPLAVTMNDGVAICVDVRPARHRAPHRAPLPGRAGRLASTHALQLAVEARDAAPAALHRRARQRRRAAARSCSPRARPIDIVTDQTSRPRPARLPARRRRLRRHGRRTPPRSPPTSPSGPASRWPGTSRPWSASWTRAPRSSTTATRSAARPNSPATSGRSPSPASSPPTSGRCSARARARSAGRRCPATRRTSPRPTRRSSTSSRRTSRWPAGSSWPASGSHFQGLPARICWLGYGERDQAGRALQRHGRRRRARAPRWRIGRDHLDCGSVASPVPRDRGHARRLRRDRRLAAAQRHGQRRLRRLLGLASTTAAASAWAARSTPGQVTVADGTPLAGEKIRRVLTNDPGMGVIRHVDAGYERADEVAAERGRPRPDAGGRRVTAPMRTGLARDAALVPTSMWARPARPIGRDAAHRRLPPLRLDRRRRRLPRLVPRAGRGPRPRLRAGPQRQPVGLARRPRTRRATPSSPAPTSTPSRTAAPSTARSASSPPSPRSTNCARRGAHFSRAARASSTSATRRAPASASPASAPGSPPGS